MSFDEKAEFAENSLEHFFEVFDRVNLLSVFFDLFNAFGMDRMTDYVFSRDSYEVVTPENGVVDAREISESGRIPVVGLGPRELIKLKIEPHPLQAAEPLPLIAQQEAADRLGGDVTAMTYSVYGIDDVGDQKILYRGSPLLIFNYLPKLKKFGRTCPTIVAHEITHVAQILSYIPHSFGTEETYKLQMSEAYLARELEACGVQVAMANNGLLDDEPLKLFDVAKKVDELRRKIQGDSFLATVMIAHAMRDDAETRRFLLPLLRGPS